MPKQPIEPNQPAVAPASSVPQPMPQNAIVPPPVQPNVSGKPSCGYTILIVILTVICTLIAEAILIFAVASWAVNHFWSSMKDGAGFMTSGTNDQVQAGGSTTLTADQKALLTKLGIKPEDLPPDLDIQKITCVQNAVGSDRIEAIISGKSTPGFGDLFKAKNCF